MLVYRPRGRRAEAPRRVRHLTAGQLAQPLLTLVHRSRRRRWLALPSMASHRAFVRLGSLWLVALVAACGGGGGDAPAPAPAATPAPAPSPVPAGTDATCALPDFQASLIARVNQLRAAGASCGSNGNFAPAAALTWNTQLTQAATAHSLDMVTNNFFDHGGSNGSTLGSRVAATGYVASALGENIAAGYGTVTNVMTGWMNSPGHCANIMNPAFTQIGVACIKGTSTNRYGDYWTMDLGRPQ